MRLKHLLEETEILYYQEENRLEIYSQPQTDDAKDQFLGGYLAVVWFGLTRSSDGAPRRLASSIILNGLSNKSPFNALPVTLKVKKRTQQTM